MQAAKTKMAEVQDEAELRKFGEHFLFMVWDKIRNLPGWPKAWCFKHNKNCSLNCPDSCGDSGKERLRIGIAGTVCTAWSRMGARLQWLDWTCVLFCIWAWEMQKWAPRLILHECTADFEWQNLSKIFSDHEVGSACFSPSDLGIPTNRSRRYSLLVRRDAVKLRVPYCLDAFAPFCFRRLATDGQCYNYLEDPCELEKHLQIMATRRHLPPRQPDGSPWSMRQLLPEGQFQRLLEYERKAAQHRGTDSVIANLKQTATFSTLSENVPCLLRGCGNVWNMKSGRHFMKSEFLLIHGISSSRHGVGSYGIELTGMRYSQFCALIGNSMHLAAVGSALGWAIAESSLLDNSTLAVREEEA